VDYSETQRRGHNKSNPKYIAPTMAEESAVDASPVRRVDSAARPSAAEPVEPQSTVSPEEQPPESAVAKKKNDGIDDVTEKKKSHGVQHMKIL